MTAGRMPRLHALDIMRGMAVAAMIVVNNPGNWNAVYRQLSHSAWNGATFADLIFPAFIFIMGVSVALVGIPSRLPPSWHGLERRTLERAATLIILGLVLNAAKAWPHLGALRIPGVLQRIGVTYLLAVVCVRLANGRQRPLWLTAIGLAVLHWIVLVWPPWTHASLAPGINAAVSVDKWLFGSHILAPSGDPEGSLGVLSSGATALIGASVGIRLSERAATAVSPTVTLPLHVSLALVGAGLLAVGYAWSIVLPLNKFLWTGSFAVFTAGAAAFALSACVLLVRLTGAALLAPFEWLGTNALTVYFLSELVASLFDRPWLTHAGHPAAPKELLFWSGLVPRLGDHGGVWSSAVYAGMYALFWIGVAGIMRWRGIRIRA